MQNTALVFGVTFITLALLLVTIVIVTITNKRYNVSKEMKYDEQSHAFEILLEIFKASGRNRPRAYGSLDSVIKTVLEKYRPSTEVKARVMELVDAMNDEELRSALIKKGFPGMLLLYEGPKEG